MDLNTISNKSFFRDVKYFSDRGWMVFRVKYFSYTWVFILLFPLGLFSQEISDRDRLFERDYSNFLEDSENVQVVKSWSEWHWAAVLGDLEKLRSSMNIANFSVRDSRGWTPLHSSVLFIDNIETIDLLLKLGAKLKARTNKGETVLLIAVEYGPLDHIEWILELGANKEVADKGGERSLHKASYLGKREAVQLLIQYKVEVDARDKLGRTPLHLAAMGGQLGTAELLLLSDADVNAKDSLDERPLHKAVLTGKPDLVELFLEFGADREVMMGSGETPLHRAVSLELFDVAEVLLTKFVDIDIYDYVNLKDNERRTALHYAVSTKNKKLIGLLLEVGANIFSEDVWGETPLDKAKAIDEIENRDMYRFLEEGYKKFRELMEASEDTRSELPCGY